MLPHQDRRTTGGVATNSHPIAASKATAPSTPITASKAAAPSTHAAGPQDPKFKAGMASQQKLNPTAAAHTTPGNPTAPRRTRLPIPPPPTATARGSAPTKGNSDGHPASPLPSTPAKPLLMAPALIARRKMGTAPAIPPAPPVEEVPAEPVEAIAPDVDCGGGVEPPVTLPPTAVYPGDEGDQPEESGITDSTSDNLVGGAVPGADNGASAPVRRVDTSETIVHGRRGARNTPSTSTTSTSNGSGDGSEDSAAPSPFELFANEEDGANRLAPSKTLLVELVQSPKTLQYVDQRIADWNSPPRLFLRGRKIVRVATNASGRVSIAPLLDDDVWSVIQEVIPIWGRTRGKRVVPATAPKSIAPLYRTYPGKSLPDLERVVSSPYIRRDGSVVSKPGYDPSTMTFLAAAPGTSFLPVSETPTFEEAQTGLSWLEALFHDFEFREPSDRTNALSMLLSPFVENIVEAPAPAFLITKNDHGVGGSLIADVASIVFTGVKTIPITTLGKRSEAEKTLRSASAAALASLLIDNVAGTIDYPALAAYLTSGGMGGRNTGTNTWNEGPGTSLTIINGVRVRTSAEIGRRLVFIELYSTHPRPSQRVPEGGWLIQQDLCEYAREQRAHLVWAILTIIRYWHVSGRPLGTRHFASFQRWADVMGGILGLFGKDDFLANTERMLADVDGETVEWTALLAAIHEAHGGRVLGAEDFLTVADRLQIDLCPHASAARQRVQAVGYALRNRAGRVFGAFRLVRVVGSRTGNSANYRVEPVN